MNKTSTKKMIAPASPKMNVDQDNEKDFPYVPGDNVINNILNYSKALSVRKSQNVGHLEMVLN